MSKKGSVLGGVLLIGGTCIGAGMLGLPVMTAAAGFFPTIGAFLLVWFFMNIAALAYLEVSLRFPGDTNLISMAAHTLGPKAKNFALVAFVFFLYSLMAAYTSGGTTMLGHIINRDAQGLFDLFTMAIFFAFPFALLVYLGPLWVDHLNRWLMLIFILAFVGICALTLRNGSTQELHLVGDSKYLLFTFSYLVTSFGYQTLIPTLKSYFHSDIKKLRLTIFIGSAMPLLFYAIWELIIMSLVPTWGENGLVQMLNSSVNSLTAMTDALAQHGKPMIICAEVFAFFALITSFLGVGLAIFDFLSDALKINKQQTSGRISLTALTFVPPIIFTVAYPGGFLHALTYAGVFASILLIIYPALMAWRARYSSKRLAGEYQMSGGKTLLVLTILFGMFVILADVFQQMGVFPIPHN